MTRKHYKAVAEAMAKEVRPVINSEAFACVIAELSRVFKTENPNFCRDKFREACYK